MSADHSSEILRDSLIAEYVEQFTGFQPKAQQSLWPFAPSEACPDRLRSTDWQTDDSGCDGTGG
jgi:hypothetical protein